MTMIRRLLRAARARLARAARIVDWDLDGALDDVMWDQAPLPEGSPIELATYLLDRATHVFVFTGSGMSQESGLATFRDETDGIYAVTEWVDMTHHDTFLERPTQMLQWHARWHEAIEGAVPNEGHRALARYALRSQGRVMIATQNVDRLIERALDEAGGERAQAIKEAIVHLHGTLDVTRCDLCHVSWEGLDWRPPRPACPHCGALDALRPDVVWFGEAPPEAAMARARRRARDAQVCLMVGTSGSVYPAASLPQVARAQGARLIEVNPTETHLSELCDVIVRGTSAHMLPKIV